MTQTPTFDPQAAESAMALFLNERLHPGQGYVDMPFAMLPSDVPGVLAFERPWDTELKGVKLDELAAHLARETGIGVVAIVTCDWSTANGDEEAMVVAFDVPGLPAEYRDDRRNRIAPVSADAVPAPEDFAVRDRALKVADSRKLALKAMLEYLPPGQEAEDAYEELDLLETHSFHAADRAVHDAIAALEFREAVRLMAASAEPEPSPAP
jgi:hypothetical protein